MERLTERTDVGQAIPRMDLRNNGYSRCLEKLADYEDKEEQGLLLRLPCKVGDSVWEIHRSYATPFEYEVTGFSLGDLLNDENIGTYDEIIVHCRNSQKNASFMFPISYFGEKVFLTKTEAEQVLTEM